MNDLDNQWKPIYRLGAITTLIVLCGIVLDMAVGAITGADLTALPQTATERFRQMNDNPWLGLYNLDFLNMAMQIIFIPSMFALCGVHRKVLRPQALLAFILFMLGTTLFVAGNTALTMLDLSGRYFAASSDDQRLLLASAGEAMMAKGAHGSRSVFLGFALIPFANALMSVVMLRGKLFSRTASWLGISGNSLMVVYVMLVTFMPGVETMAMAFAMPAGLLVMGWMGMFAARLFRSRPF